MKQLRISPSVTTRGSGAFDSYLRDIRKTPLITAEEEVHLMELSKQGDKKALEKVCSANLRFVVSVAKQYTRDEFLLEELVQAGNMGLRKAAQRFDHTRGFKFISYAVRYIRRYIQTYLADTPSLIRIPQSTQAKVKAVEQMISVLEQGNGRPVYAPEIAQALDISFQELAIIQGYDMSIASLDAPFLGADEDGGNLLAVTSDKNQLNPQQEYLVAEENTSFIAHIKYLLSPLAADILFMAYGIGYPAPYHISVIAKQYKITEREVDAIKYMAVLFLRRYMPAIQAIYESSSYEEDLEKKLPPLHKFHHSHIVLGKYSLIHERFQQKNKNTTVTKMKYTKRKRKDTSYESAIQHSLILKKHTIEQMVAGKRSDAKKQLFKDFCAFYIPAIEKNTAADAETLTMLICRKYRKHVIKRQQVQEYIDLMTGTTGSI